ncbi:NAD(P)/FAD-dependent oxidoreductase [Aeromonas cavernicola]|uniref:FAD-dependent oxidoreductase n=1 Tax=Aeromonas cavernicola TaxID=1006623 RepID=A0A2H9U9I5_9GAMM|nr:FAD-dependent oxidoreductase [Aeromonas cavernicola]PJG60649.1 FAD-dependent oxidoreductase [Aeromonas cavernicola]
MHPDIRRIVIIGAGQASAWAAHTLRQQGYMGRLSVISAEAQVFYERPPLSKQVLAGTMAPAALQLFSEEAIAELAIDWHKPVLATAIDPQQRQVHLANGVCLAYDKLLIATGSRARVPVSDWLGLAQVVTLRTLDDAARLRERLLPGQRLAILGGGWIGLEVAATARSLGVAVSLFEQGNRLCARSVRPELSAFLLQLHQEQGVDVQLACGAIDLVATDSGVVQLWRADQCIGEVDTVVVGAGAEIACELGRDAGLAVNHGLLVDEFGRTSHPDIYAAGDVAVHPELGVCVQSWANAQHQAISAAKSMLGEPCEYRDPLWIWSDQYQCNIQMLGTPANQASRLVERIVSEQQRAFIYLDEENRLTSMVTINDAKLMKLGKRWLKSGTVLPAAQLADPAANMMALKP